MEKEERRAAKERLITLMQAGHSWHEAAKLAGVQIGRSAAYHLLRNVRLRGGVALQFPVQLSDRVAARLPSFDELGQMWINAGLAGAWLLFGKRAIQAAEVVTVRVGRISRT